MSQTYGIVFLGTPHRGSNLAGILNNILRTSPNTSTKVFVSELEKGSTSLADINEQFRHVCGDLALVSFHETLKTTLGPGVKAMVSFLRINLLKARTNSYCLFTSRLSTKIPRSLDTPQRHRHLCWRTITGWRNSLILTTETMAMSETYWGDW
jgi:hypothetical protein